MDIRKLPLAPPGITAFVMAVALTFPCAIGAVSIGEIVMQSGRGEPLLANVGSSSIALYFSLGCQRILFFKHIV